MSRRIDIKLACISLIVGCLLSFSLLSFLFGTRIYSRYFFFGLLAPSSWLSKLGRFGLFDWLVSNTLDALFFAAGIYAFVRLSSYLFGKQEYQ
jgi:hypothetical protein